MNADFNPDILEFLTAQGFGPVLSLQPVSGGSINAAYRLKTSAGPYFLKVNGASESPLMFEAEERGLELLCRSDFIIPKPMITGTVGNEQFILMEWMEKGSPKQNFWEVFGRNLADLHRLSDKRFGLNHDNYIGSLPQLNRPEETWAEFYRDQRLMPQMELAEKSGRLSQRMKQGFEGLFQHLDAIFPMEKPSLVHGDLWSGNLMVAADGSPCIFDPAMYYGHREMDLAMMALFGGFGDAWVNSYNEMHPLENGWRERIPIGQLYPLMVHVNLFGGGYGQRVERILQKFM